MIAAGIVFAFLTAGLFTVTFLVSIARWRDWTNNIYGSSSLRPPVEKWREEVDSIHSALQEENILLERRIASLEESMRVKES